MDFAKPGSSESSDDEYDGQEHVKEDSYDPRKRPYECTFCKRGFTNAQALGGHMNIHRKDRAKAKQRLHSTSSHANAHYNENSDGGGCNYFAPISNPPATPYNPPASFAAAHRHGYRTYFEPSGAPSYTIHQQRSQGLSVNEEALLGVNLSLQIDQTRGVWKNEELDLELRLGHEYR